jgi:RNA polymerase sigma factor (sigma-70 family)
MAGDLIRAHAVIAACARHLAGPLGIPATDIIGPLTAETASELARRTVGEQQQVVLDACTEYARRSLRRAITSASAELSNLTGLPPAAMRTSAGWAAALVSAGHRADALSAPETLPGTRIVNAVLAVQALANAADDETTLARVMAAAWGDGARDGGYDATVERLLPQNPLAGELGWALIGFETHKHVKLIWHQANKLERSFPDRSADDLLGWGWLGLRTALRHYNPDLGFTFSTYACTRIIGSIRDGVRAESPVPKRLNTFSRKVAAAEAELTQKLGRAPTMDEVSASIGVELDALALVKRTAPQASVDEILDVLADRGTAPSWMVLDDDPAEEAMAAVRRDAVSAALAELPAEDRAAVKLLVMDGLNPTEARQVTGATARQLRQRKERGLAALRTHLETWQLDSIDDEDSDQPQAG